MSFQLSTPKYNSGNLLNDSKYAHWRRLMLEHSRVSDLNKWLLIYGNLWDARKNIVNKYLFMDMLQMLDEEL